MQTLDHKPETLNDEHADAAQNKLDDHQGFTPAAGRDIFFTHPIFSLPRRFVIEAPLTQIAPRAFRQIRSLHLKAVPGSGVLLYELKQ